MNLQIKSVVLWPRKIGLEPRILVLKPGRVNVISGLSKTGKSAIIPIIDYCLGADKCAIPVNTIRKACSWFGVLFSTSQGDLLLARREPATQKSTGDMFVLQGENVSIPPTIETPNANVEAVKAVLNDLAGLTQLDFDVERSGAGYKARPSFRDMVAFVFQPQHIIANPNILFFKADTTEHREKLRTIFPYVLGAITAEGLAVEHELQRLRADLRRRERELAVLRQLSLNWMAEIRAKVSRAHELGLLLRAPEVSATAEDLIGSLRAAALPPGDGHPELALSGNALTGAAEELVALQTEEATVSSSLSRLKQRISDMTRFREAATEFRGALSIRRDRLQMSDWIANLFDTHHECPLCGTRESVSSGEVEGLRAALRRVESEASVVAQVPAAFDREYQRVREDLDLEIERLNAVRLRRRLLQATSEEARSRQFQLSEAARFAGALEEALLRYDQLGTDGELTRDVFELKERIANLETRLRELDSAAALSRVKRRFTALVGRILPRLDTERADDPVELVIEDLTIRVAGHGRDDYLWEIGSGANWLAYHMSTSVALHQLFRGLPQNHVPTFAVYDQPSQVYFPKLGEGQASAIPQSGAGSVLRDEDVLAVRKVFQLLSDMARASGGEWQAVVLDHAGPDVWGDISGVHSVEDWHGGLKLVPDAWLE
jgi:hypothetical protein